MANINNTNFTGKQVLSIISILNKNNDEFKQKIKVLEKDVVVGAERKDKDGNILYDKNTGEVLRWDDKYKITFIAVNTGSEKHSIYVSMEQYDKLKVGETYNASGVVNYKTIGNDYSSRAIVEFDSFVNINEQIENILKEYSSDTLK